MRDFLFGVVIIALSFLFVTAADASHALNTGQWLIYASVVSFFGGVGLIIKSVVEDK